MDDHAYWYLGLSALALLLLAYVLFAARELRRPLLVYGIAVGYGFMIESVIYNFLSSYRYDPNLIALDAYYDSNVGALASNALALPIAATAIAALGLGWRGIVLFTLFFGCVEWLFLKLGIYEHNWWRTWYTMSGLPFYYGAAIWLYPRLSRPMRGPLLKIALYAITAAIAGSLDIAPIILFGVRSYTPGWFAEAGHDTTAFANVFFLGMSLIYVGFACIRWRRPWAKYACTAAIMYAATLLLRASGLLHSQLWWDGLYYVALSVLMAWIAGALHRKLLHP